MGLGDTHVIYGVSDGPSVGPTGCKLVPSHILRCAAGDRGGADGIGGVADDLDENVL